MKQVAVTKTTVNLDKGKPVIVNRNMMIPQSMWDNIVENGYHEGNVTFELRKTKPAKGKSIEMIPKEVNLKPGDKGKKETPKKDTGAKKKDEPIKLEDANMEQLREMYKERFGRYPGNWKEETIKGKLS